MSAEVSKADEIQKTIQYGQEGQRAMLWAADYLVELHNLDRPEDIHAMRAVITLGMSYELAIERIMERKKKRNSK